MRSRGIRKKISSMLCSRIFRYTLSTEQQDEIEAIRKVLCDFDETVEDLGHKLFVLKDQQPVARSATSITEDAAEEGEDRTLFAETIALQNEMKRNLTFLQDSLKQLREMEQELEAGHPWMKRYSYPDRRRLAALLF